MKKLIYITFFLLTSHLASQDISQDILNVYALYTPSHEILVDTFFLPSLEKINDPYIKVILHKEAEQSCQSAHFMHSGWTKTTIKKIKLILKAIEENWGNIFIFSDVDIQFFTPFKNIILELMENYDLLIQKDNPKGTLCSGFFACRANHKTRQLFSDVLQYMLQHEEISDQRALNRHISRNETKNKYDISWNYLPTDLFFGGGTFTGKIWNQKSALPIPENPIMHHANWVAGIEGKIKQLNYVKKMIDQREEK